MNTERTDVPRHPIRVVSKRTGLTPALLRAWEKRYGVVSPSRSGGGQRLYTDDDVHRLALLHRAVEEGRNISQVAPLSVEELEELVREDQVERVGPPAAEPLEAISASGLLEKAGRAVREMNPSELDRILVRGALALPVPTLLDEIVSPLLASIGAAWSAGTLGPAQEHVASVVVRRFLDWLLSTMGAEKGAAVIVTGTPAGERHELGALLAAVSAAAEGWRAVYLGPDLPASEIATAATRVGARVVAVSVVDPTKADLMAEEVHRIRQVLPGSIRLIVGGPSEILSRVNGRGDGVELMEGLPELRADLARR